MAPLVMLARFVARPGAEERLLKELHAMVAPSTAEPGCLHYQPLTDPDDPATVVMWQEWADRAALEVHIASPHFARAAPILAELIASPVEIAELVANPENPHSTISPETLRARATNDPQRS